MGHEGWFGTGTGAGMGAAMWIVWIIVILAIIALIKYLAGK